MVRVTYGSKFSGEPWSYVAHRYEVTECDVPAKPEIYTDIGNHVAAYAREGASKISIKIERL